MIIPVLQLSINKAGDLQGIEKKEEEEIRL
jgi:hypothetical protein